MMHKNSIKYILIIIIFFFICSYYVSNSGYYEYHLQEQTNLTNELIKQFEQDIKNNEFIDINSYLENKEVNYSNKITNFVYNISNDCEEISKKILSLIFKKLSYLVKD